MRSKQSGGRRRQQKGRRRRRKKKMATKTKAAVVPVAVEGAQHLTLEILKASGLLLMGP